MEMIVTFPGGKRVDAQYGDQVIKTDQPLNEGGKGSAPEPYAYFLASIGTCAGIYILGFCRSRHVPTEGLRVVQRMEWNEARHRLEKVTLDIVTPPGFPDKYRKALMRAADMCAVKRTIMDPPVFEVRTVKRGSSAPPL